MLVSKWSIEDISFNAKDCREKFNNLEEIVPLGTAIRVAGAGNLKGLSYKGGLKGEVEHSQLRLARTKLLKKKLQEKPQ